MSNCIITIGYRRYLVPQSKALQVMNALSGAVEVEADFSSETRGYVYRVGDVIELEMRNLQSKDQVIAKAVPRPESKAAQKSRPVADDDGGPVIDVPGRSAPKAKTKAKRLNGVHRALPAQSTLFLEDAGK